MSITRADLKSARDATLLFAVQMSCIPDRIPAI